MQERERFFRDFFLTKKCKNMLIVLILIMEIVSAKRTLDPFMSKDFSDVFHVELERDKLYF